MQLLPITARTKMAPNDRKCFHVQLKNEELKNHLYITTFHHKETAYHSAIHRYHQSSVSAHHIDKIDPYIGNRYYI